MRQQKSTYAWFAFSAGLGLDLVLLYFISGLEFSRLESWSRDVSRLNFESLGLGLGLGLEGPGSWSWSRDYFVAVK